MNETQTLLVNLVCQEEPKEYKKIRTVKIELQPKQVSVVKWSDHDVYLSPEAFHVQIDNTDQEDPKKLQIQFIRASSEYRFYNNSVSYYTIFSKNEEYFVFKVIGPFAKQTLSTTNLTHAILLISRDRISSSLKSVQEDNLKMNMVHHEPRITQISHSSIFNLLKPMKDAFSRSYINPEQSRYETHDFELPELFKTFLIKLLTFQRINTNNIDLHVQIPIWTISKRIPEEFSEETKGGILVFLNNSDDFANFWLELFSIGKKVLMKPGTMIMFEGPIPYIIRGRQSNRASQYILKIVFK